MATVLMTSRLEEMIPVNIITTPKIADKTIAFIIRPIALLNKHFRQNEIAGALCNIQHECWVYPNNNNQNNQDH